MRIGVVGTGAMGRPLVDRLLAAGHDVAAFARRAEVREELTAAGVEVVDTIGELGRTRDVVLVYVYADEQVREVAAELEPGPLVVVHTTGSPRTVAQMAARGLAVVDAPGSGGPDQVADGTLTLFVGGDTRHVARLEPVFAAYSMSVVHVGALGAGQQVKLLNNLLFGAHVQLALDAARAAQALGIDVPDLMRTLRTCSGQSYATDLVAAMGSAEALVQAAGPFVRKDVAIARAVAEELGAPLGAIKGATEPLLGP